MTVLWAGLMAVLALRGVAIISRWLVILVFETWLGIQDLEAHIAHWLGQP